MFYICRSSYSLDELMISLTALLIFQQSKRVPRWFSDVTKGRHPLFVKYSVECVSIFKLYDNEFDGIVRNLENCEIL